MASPLVMVGASLVMVGASLVIASEAKQSIFFATRTALFFASHHCKNTDKIPAPNTILTRQRICPMDPAEYTTKLDELDHLLNDPDVQLEPDRVWTLLAELSRHDLQPTPQRPS